MRGGVILIVIALFVGYLGVSGKYKCFSAMLGCLTGSGGDCGCKGSPASNVAQSGSFPSIAPLSPIPPLSPPFVG